MTRIIDLPDTAHVLPGNRACAGCPLGIALRRITGALDGRMVMVNPASCLTVLGGMYPTASLAIPWVNCAFPSTAATASGISAGLRAMGRDDEMTVVAMAGDGGTADIGIQALSGAAERNEDFVYICYDNEAYMNTGTQRSGSTPQGARTTTTWGGKRENPKDVLAIMEAHGVPYVASTSAVFPDDLHDKITKAASMKGLRYIHMSLPCPSGWAFDPKDSVNIGKLAVDCGLVALYEVDEDGFRLTGKSAALAKSGLRATVAEYVGTQGRFKGVSEEVVSAMQEWVEERWSGLVARHEAGA